MSRKHLGLLEASGTVLVDDGKVMFFAKVSRGHLACVGQWADYAHVSGLDLVVGLHCANLMS